MIMKPEKVDPVVANIRDSVSRIIYNMGFSSCDNTAHSKLCRIIINKLDQMSLSCRVLTENAGRKTMSTTSHDLHHFFRMNKLNRDELIGYMEQVGPFPPEVYEIHGDPLFGKSKIAPEAPLDVPEVVESPKKKKKKFVMPKFDDLDDKDLGYSSFLDSPPPPPPPIPPPLPLVFPDFPIPIFDPEVPPPEIPNYMNPDVPVRPPIDPPAKFKILDSFSAPASCSSAVPKFMIKHAPCPIKPSRISKSLDLPRPHPFEKSSSSLSLTHEIRKTKKRTMQSNYEQRLRREQMALEERKREMKRKNAEHREKSAEKPSIVFTFEKKVVAKVGSSLGEQLKDINDNKRKYKKRVKRVAPVVAGLVVKPMPKLNIRFRTAKRGVLIKRVVTTSYNNVHGRWVPVEKTTFRNNRGVLSFPQFALKKGPKIEKIRLKRDADGGFRVIS